MNGSARLLLLGATAVVCVVAARAQDDPVGDALRAADDLAERGRFREAIAALERDRARLTALDPEGWAEHGPRTLALYRTFVAEEERFERAVAEAAQQRTAALEAWVREVEAGGYKHVGYAFVDSWRARARAALGDEAYRKIVSDLEGEALQAMPLDDVLKTDPEAEVEGPTVTAPAVQRRGSAERRARMRAQAEADRATLARVRAEVAAVESARAARERAAAERARGAKLGGHTLLGWDASGFTVESATARREVTTPWDEAHPLTAVWVRGRGVAPDDAEALHEWGRFALTRGCVEHAERALAQAAAIDSRWARTDLDLADLRRRAEPFQAKPPPGTTTDRTASSFLWTFDDSLEALDLAPASSDTTVEVAGGELVLRCPSSAALARVAGEWSWRVQVGLTPGASTPPALIALSGRAARVFVELGASRVRLLVVERDREVEMARADHPAPATLRVAGVVSGDGPVQRLRVVVLDGAREVIAHELAWAGPLQVLVGAAGREARIDALTISGELTGGGGSGPARLVRALAEADAARGRGGLAIAYRHSSAEDDVGLVGVSADARALLDEGRVSIRQGEPALALARFEAARDQAPTCAAALLLSGRARLDLGDVQGALERADAADALLEDLHEAWALRAAALLRWWRVAEAEVQLDRAAALAPASPPVWRARADLLLRRGDREGAREAAVLAAALAPDDHDLAAAAARMTAIANEPAVSGRVIAGSVVLISDAPEPARAGLKVVAGELDRLLATLPRALPWLAAKAPAPAPARLRRVVLLDSAATFQRHLAARGVDVDADTTWHADPVAGDVFVLRDVGRSLQRARRALVHVWLEEQGAVGLPPWAREGLALCFGESDAGTLVNPGLVPTTDERLDQLATLAVGWSRRPRFFDLAAGIRRPPELAFPELDDALAWALFAHCLTPGARAERFEGGQVVLADVLADYLGRLAAPSGEKARLEHAWVETFHTLDRRSLEEGVERALREQAARAGIDWPAR